MDRKRGFPVLRSLSGDGGAQPCPALNGKTPGIVKAGSIKITKFRVIENTGEYRAGKYVEHPDATTHFVEAKFELGANAAATLHKGDAVIVVGREHTNSWGDEGAKTYGRVIEADNIGVDLSRAVAQVRRVTRNDNGE